MRKGECAGARGRRGFSCPPSCADRALSARTLIPRFGTACSFGEHPMVSSAAPPAQEAIMRWPTPVLCAVVAATPFSASLASHTPNPTSVTIAGSYQAALGCPGDWQPDCLRSLLEDPDGDGIYKFTAPIPAGNYEVKVAINESWSENYGAGGAPNGSNIPFTVATDCQATEFTYDS